jgi:hypothetical protein
MHQRKRLAIVSCLFLGMGLYAEATRICVWLYAWWDAPMAVTEWGASGADG